MPLTLVRLALLPEFSSSFDRRFAPVLFEVIVRHDLTTHKFVLEIRAVTGEYIGFLLSQNWTGVHTE
jgi:hypothetical protein